MFLWCNIKSNHITHFSYDRIIIQFNTYKSIANEKSPISKLISPFFSTRLRKRNALNFLLFFVGPNEEWKSAEAMNYLLNNITISARTRPIESRRRRRQILSLSVDFKTFEIRNEGKLSPFLTLPTRQRQRKVWSKSYQLLDFQVLVFLIHDSTYIIIAYRQLCDDAWMDAQRNRFHIFRGRHSVYLILPIAKNSFFISTTVMAPFTCLKSICYLILVSSIRVNPM